MQSFIEIGWDVEEEKVRSKENDAVSESLAWGCFKMASLKNPR